MTMETDMAVDVRRLHRDAVGAFSERVDLVRADAWGLPTPCADWDVRALVNHVVGENRWVVPLAGGSTIAEVGTALDGDLLGGDGVAAWHASVGPALESVGRTPLDALVHLSFGDVAMEEYLWQLTTDALIHAWDLARAIGSDESLPGAVVEACSRWFDGVEAMYRGAGLIGPAIPVAGGDAADVLLGRFGRDPAPVPAPR